MVKIYEGHAHKPAVAAGVPLDVNSLEYEFNQLLFVECEQSCVNPLQFPFGILSSSCHRSEILVLVKK